ncbi:MAG: hypothetical protein CR962_01080 [Gammaproteobacteria bacterium]|nr:MAG: hypothetical protein CR962_01080 [Gammaproteobacteria bacterium]
MTNTPTFIYYTALGQYESLSRYLNQADQKKQLTFTNPIRRQTFIAGRALLAIALKCHYGSNRYQIAYTEAGKPYLHFPKGYYFNLTHSSNHLYLALQQTQPIGIDCEVIRQKNYQRVAKRLFSHEEYHKIANNKDPLAAFFLRWTQYEAAVKYAGKSIFSKPGWENNQENNQANNTIIYSFRHQQQILSICTAADTAMSLQCYQWCADSQQIKRFKLHFLSKLTSPG